MLLSRRSPLAQIKSTLNSPLASLLTEKKVSHISNTYNIGDDTEPELTFKFSKEKALEYLTKKHGRVLAVLQKQAFKSNPTNDASMKSASFNTGFNIDAENKDPGAALAPDLAAGLEPEVDPVSSAAALHVCEYLSTETAKALLEKLSLPVSVLEPPKGSKRKSWEHHDGEQEKLLEYTRGGNVGEDGAEKKKVRLSTQPAAARAL